MNRQRTYLDHNATSELRPEVREAMLAALELSGNPSSVHEEGRRARGLIEDAREKVAALVAARPKEVIFTSGGTEANNMVLGQPWGGIIAPATEHDSVLAPADKGPAKLALLPVDRDGVVDLERVSGLLMDFAGTEDGPILVSVQMANNETGVLQDLTKIRATIERFKSDHAPDTEIFLHSDAVQAAGKIPIDFAHLGVDAMSLSAHKFGGPKGVGALVKRTGFALKPRVFGGGQEGYARSGTENTSGIAGMAKAAELALDETGDMSNIRQMRDRLESETQSRIEGAVIIAKDTDRLPNTSAIAVPGTSAETTVIAFDLEGFAISAGAACTSGKVGSSKVLEAMGLDDSLTGSTIRVSLGWNSNETQIEEFLAAAEKIWSSRSATRAA